jgi:hypothetical protein
MSKPVEVFFSGASSGSPLILLAPTFSNACHRQTHLLQTLRPRCGVTAAIRARAVALTFYTRSLIVVSIKIGIAFYSHAIAKTSIFRNLYRGLMR